MPRIYIAATPPGPCCVSSITILGEAPAKSRTSESKRLSSSSADSALTDAGTSCMFSSRLRAVTVISSSPCDSACVSVLVSCALTNVAGYKIIAAVVSSRVIFIPFIMIIPLQKRAHDLFAIPPAVGVVYAPIFRMPHLLVIDKQILLKAQVI